MEFGKQKFAVIENRQIALAFAKKGGNLSNSRKSEFYKFRFPRSALCIERIKQNVRKSSY